MQDDINDLEKYASLAVRRAVQRRFLAQASPRLLGQLATKLDDLDGCLTAQERSIVLATFGRVAAELYGEDSADTPDDRSSE
jgi:hypothetical protein